jgi:photosystem II stability/assembly factor-like uncharacterized protein
MPNGEKVFDSSNGSLFVQPNGPGTAMYFLGCHSIDDIEAPQGEIELVPNYTADRTWEVIGQKKAPPEIVTTTITGMTKKTRDWLEKLRCSGIAALYVLESSCGKRDDPANWERAKALQRINISSKTYAGTANNAEVTDSTHAIAIQAWFPLIESVEVTIKRLTNPSTLAANGIWADNAGQCLGDCGSNVNPGDILGIAPDSAPAAATGDILFSTDAGITIAAGAADPFAAGLHTMGITAFPINKTGRRWLVGKEATAGTQGQVAYSDDAGATWTTVSIGGAAAGHGAVYGKCLFSLNGQFIVLAGRVGYIYKSINNGATWVAKDAGVVTSGNYSAVHFADEKYGAAVAAAGVVAITRDGGESWQAATVIGGGAAANLCVHVFNDKRILVGDDAGKLWQSTDFGTTWTQISGWTGSGAGDVRDIMFVNDFVGFMAYNNASPVGSVLRTIDGGANWAVISGTPTNVGLNSIWAVDENTAYTVGEASGGTGVVLKISEA